MNKLVKYLPFCLLFLLVGACKQEIENKAVDKILDIRLRQDPQVLNPILSNFSEARLVHQYLFLSLADYDPSTYELIPILMDEIPELSERKDGKVEVDIKIRKDAVWDDGVAITASDYLYTMKIIMSPVISSSVNPSNYSEDPEFFPSENDPKVFKLVLPEYNMRLLEALIGIPLMPAHIYDPQNRLADISLQDISNEKKMQDLINADEGFAEYINDLNGAKYSIEVVSNAGPYRLASWETDQSLVLEKKKDYWGNNYPDNPYLMQGPEKMHFYVIPDETTVISQLKEGVLDISNNISATGFNDLKENQEYSNDFQFFTSALNRYYYLIMNNRDPILADKDVRKAISHLLDVDAIIENSEQGMGKRVASLVHPDRRYYNQNLPLITFDPEMAKKILIEDGWKDVDNDGDLDKSINGQMKDLTLDVYVTESQLGQNVALMLQENGKKIGVNVNIIPKSFGAYVKENLATRNYSLAALAATQSSGDDDFYPTWHSDNDEAGKGNYSSFQNEKADALMEKIRNTRTAKERDPLYKELQKVVYEDSPVIFLYAPTEKIILNKRWNGKPTFLRPGYFANTFTPVK